MVVIPALLNRPDDVDDLFGQLEMHYLRNVDPGGNIAFALLTDFGDAQEEFLAEDQALIAHARATLEALNARYPDRPFCFFHRKRLWNPAEEAWMGWERKRGKLHEFNRLLRASQAHESTDQPQVSTDTLRVGDTLFDTSFVVAEGDLTRLSQIRYVITLDADTVLPRDAARRLIGTLAHPLNQAEFDPDTGRVIAGYTVLQPRTEINATSANRSIFTQSLPVMPGSISIPWPSPMSIKTSLAQAFMWARASMMSTRSSAVWPALSPRTRCSVMISLKGFKAALGWSAM